MLGRAAEEQALRRLVCPTVDPLLARRCWRILEPVHGLVYFVREGPQTYARLGVEDRTTAYFGTRSAAMGRVGAEMVIATFFNFSPALVRRHVPRVWDLASPEDLLAARLEVVDAAMRRALPSEMLSSAEMEDLAALARRAAEEACLHPEGRPLFAAHSSLEWPSEPHLVLWHAQTLLREFRGDAHVAALLLEGLDGVEALVSHSAADPANAFRLRPTRAWSDEEWEGAVDRLRWRGLLEPDGDPIFTEAGVAQRERLETSTDRSSVVAYAALGDADCDRLCTLARPLSRAIVDAGMLKMDPSTFLAE